MTKKKLIQNWKEEAGNWYVAEKNMKFKAKTRALAYNRRYQLLKCIYELEHLKCG
jgi:hypothetical protein